MPLRTVIAASTLVVLVACSDDANYATSVPSAKTTTAPPAAASDATANGATTSDAATKPRNGRQSSSVLGKARDSALNVKDQAEARDREIQKQIDDMPH